MLNMADLIQQIDRLADRLRAARRDREQRLKLAMEMLADVEERVKAQRMALDQANARVKELETERANLLTRMDEVVKLYDRNLTENDGLFNRIEAMSTKVAAETGASPRSNSSAVLHAADGSVTVQGPSNTLFLKDLDTNPAPARDRFKDNEAIRRLYDQYHQKNGGKGGIA